MQAQAQLFSEAAIVIGEDGSGLHNTIFSAPGTRVICLNFGRTNIFHASIAAIRAHKLAYLQANPGAGNAEDISYTIEVERLMDTVTTLQAM